MFHYKAPKTNKGLNKLPGEKIAFAVSHSKTNFQRCSKYVAVLQLVLEEPKCKSHSRTKTLITA